ncbi:tape measure protein [Aquipseudomonas alcaligenes]|uniref:Tape measure protein n=1 Tax=Aquipseudomonas alcaligenes TaxID=43263 RepID=A0AA42N0P1_AQUAC|nr:tape measure protein [Pseudomonas alcaligenes]MDH1055308.1 tape measure protein [Pseudomonas alcaligenes]
MSDVELRLTADLDQALKQVRGFSKEYAGLVGQIEKPLRQTNFARDLERDLEGSGKAIQAAKARLSELQRELINTDNPTERLKESFKAAARELQRLERVEAAQVSQLSRVRAELRGAGVDTTRLAAEQRRLSAEMAKALSAGRADAAARGIRERAAALKQQSIAQRQANLEAARATFGVTQARAAKQELVSLRQQFELLKSRGGLTTQELAMAQRQLKQRIAETKRELKSLQGGFSIDIGGAAAGGGGKGGAAAAVAVAAAAAAGAGAAQVAQGADEVGRLDTRLKLATKSQEEFNRAQFELDRIADETQGDISGLVGLYSRLQRPLRDVGMGQKETLETIEAVSLAMKIGGTSAEESSAAIQQLSQALASGTLRGDEFSSVLEQSDRVAGALADEFGVTIGQLREMASQGQITTEAIVKAFGNQLPKLRQEFAQFSPELTTAISRAGTELKRYWGRQAKESGVTDYFASVINDYAKGVNRVAQAEQQSYDSRAQSLRSHNAEMVDLQKQASVARKAALDEQVRNTEAALKKQVEAERKAASELAKAKQSQLESQQRYKAALASLNSSGQGADPSFSQASALKVGARQALQSGDVEEAKRQAQAALEILQQLAQAGENTYGFAGVIKELQAIEESADGKKVDEAQAKLDKAKEAAAQTKAALEELKDIKVQPTLDAEAQQALLDQMARLADQAKIIMTIPVTYQQSDFDPVSGDYILQQPNLEPPGFADGGWTGPGGKYQPAGLVHRGEHVQPQEVVREPGALPFLEQIRRNGFRNTVSSLRDRLAAGLPGFAEGGLVGPRSLPAMPPIPQSLLQGGGVSESLGTLVLQLGGQQFSVQAPRSTAEELSRTARKLGATRR